MLPGKTENDERKNNEQGSHKIEDGSEKRKSECVKI